MASWNATAVFLLQTLLYELYISGLKIYVSKLFVLGDHAKTLPFCTMYIYNIYTILQHWSFSSFYIYYMNYFVTCTLLLPHFICHVYRFISCIYQYQNGSVFAHTILCTYVIWTILQHFNMAYIIDYDDDENTLVM